MNERNIQVVCFGGEDWWYHNRGHIDMQMMRRFSKAGTTLYINSIVMQKPGFGKKTTKNNATFWQKLKRKTTSIFKGLKDSGEGFLVYSPFTLPVHHIGWLRVLNEMFLRMQVAIVMKRLKIKEPVVWVACPAACDTAIKFRKNKLVYQRTDHYEEYPNVDKEIISRYDADLKKNADLTVFVNQLMYDQEKGQCKKAMFLDHGVDFDKFADAENNEFIPDDIKGIAKPIIGYFGAISGHNTVDIDLIAKVADILSDMSIVLIGKCATEYEQLISRKNIYLLGQKNYSQIPDYGKCFDVAIMPWNQNKWIEVCNPIKMKEYLALGKPVISTGFAELEKYRDVIYKASDAEEFAKLIKKAIAEDDEELKQKRRDKVKSASWESKAEVVLKELFE